MNKYVKYVKYVNQNKIIYDSDQSSKMRTRADSPLKDTLRIHFLPKVQYDQNFSTLRYKKNLKKNHTY